MRKIQNFEKKSEIEKKKLRNFFFGKIHIFKKIPEIEKKIFWKNPHFQKKWKNQKKNLGVKNFFGEILIFWEILTIWGYPDIKRIPSNSTFSFVPKYKRIACFSFVRKNRQTNRQTNSQNSVAKTCLSARGASRQIIDNDDRSQEYIFFRNTNS